MDLNYLLRLQYEGVYGELQYYRQLPLTPENLSHIEKLEQQEQDLLNRIALLTNN